MKTSREQVEGLTRSLLEWGRENRRRYPWRDTDDPYRILVAEVLLHRTRADQVVKTYVELVNRYPDIASLASAQQRDLTTLLHPLGLHWRVRLLHEAARRIATRFGGRVPADSSELQSLPGVSEYIAAAVRCFAFGFPELLLDTNTVRVVGRLLGLKTNDSHRRNRAFKDMATHVIQLEHPREVNFALLDLGAMVCTARGVPACEVCPIHRWCEWRMRLEKADAIQGGYCCARGLCERPGEGGPGSSRRDA